VLLMSWVRRRLWSFLMRIATRCNRIKADEAHTIGERGHPV